MIIFSAFGFSNEYCA